MTAPDVPSLVAIDRSISSIDRVLDELMDVWRRNPWVGEFDRMAVQTAIVELATNIVRYALPDADDTAELTVVIAEGKLRADVTDHGPRFTGALHDLAMPDPLAESGRGLGVIAALMHTFSYTRSADGNHWMIVRSLTPSGPPQ